MRKRILGVSRSPRFSPNSQTRDEAIFQGVVTELQRQGYEVERICEDDFVTATGYDAVFSMARDLRVLQTLAVSEQSGLPVFNSAQALLQATRVVQTATFEAEGIPVPDSPVLFRRNGAKMVPLLRDAGFKSWHFPVWLKRSEACAQSAADVCFVENEEQLATALTGYASRQIDEVLVSEHLRGDLVKFYGVEGTPFFYSYYPTSDNAFSKFGLERINGAPSGFPLDLEALKQVADRAAASCGMVIYGGDCIVDEQGRFRIIDFNDWPSYSRCCGEASRAIADKISQAIRDKN